MNYYLHLTIYFSIYVIAASGLSVITNHSALLTMAHASYFAMGAYAYALISIKAEVDFPLAFSAAVAVSMLMSFLTFIPSWRFRGDLFVMLSLSSQVVILNGLSHWFSPESELGTLGNLTNGLFGISGIPKPRIFGLEVAGQWEMTAFAGTIAAALFLLISIFLASPWGRLLQAIGDDELAARSLGKNVRRAKTQAFAAACGAAGAAGALYAAYVGYIHPSTGSLDHSILMLSMVLVGGRSLLSPIIGASLLLGIPEVLRCLQIGELRAANIRMMVFGLLLVLLMRRRADESMMREVTG